MKKYRQPAPIVYGTEFIIGHEIEIVENLYKKLIKQAE